jgi:uncharacterized protein (DUF488 family)
VVLLTYGYGGNGVPPLQRIAAVGVLVVDIRAAPHSAYPGYRKASLEQALGDRYRYLGDLGNINHRTPGAPIVLRNPERGLPALAELMATGEVCIMCGCEDWRECHRALVGRLMQERLAGLAVVHLDAGEVERRWPLATARREE